MLFLPQKINKILENFPKEKVDVVVEGTNHFLCTPVKHICVLLERNSNFINLNKIA